MSRMQTMHYIKNLKLIERNKEWLSANGVSGKDKFSYYGHIALSYAMQKKKITYLGRALYYDNPATPLNLQNYPHEIVKKILGNMHAHPKLVLDIGGNLGQFSLTMNYILKNKAKIDSFEPNSFIYEFLIKNTEGTPIRAFNFGLGEKEGKVQLHFDPDRTAIGSVIKNNAGTGAVLTQDIAITATPEKITKRTKYDLVKVDVEGYEMHALKGLKNISFEYLFIEFSGQGREKDYQHSDLLALLKKQWGSFDIYYASPVRKDCDTFDMLIRFAK